MMIDDEKKLADVSPDKTFKTHKGGEIKNLRQLQSVLGEISQESFEHHVNDERNDFANWVKHSVGDDELADMLEKTVDFEKTKRIIQDRISLLEKKVEVKKIRESLESLKGDTIGIDRVPDDLQSPDMPPEHPPADTGPEESASFEVSEEPKKIEDVMHGTGEIAKGPVKGLHEKHPFEHIKTNLYLRIRDILVGVFIGLVLGYILGAYL